MEIRTRKSDIIWNYIGTVVTMASGFVLLPFLMAYLSGDALGLWYVFLAISNLSMLFEWGFEPTFARNIVYVLSGARKLTREGCDSGSMQEGIDGHLLRIMLSTTKVVFAIIAVISTAGVALAGTAYVAYITEGMTDESFWISWAIFVIAIFLNLYYLYCVTFLRGTGDVAGENRAVTISRAVQLVISAVLLVLGLGLIGAAIGYLLNGLTMRFVSMLYLRHHTEVNKALHDKDDRVERDELRAALNTVSYVALRNCLVQFASYASSQASTILCSLFLSLTDTGLFSVCLQLGNAVGNFACSYMRSFMPALQSAYSSDDVTRKETIVGRGVAVYWILIVLGTIAVPVVVFPLLKLIRPDKTLDVPLFVGVSLYLAFLNHTNLMTSVILSGNHIPFTKAFVISAIAGIGTSAVLMAWTPLAAWGLILGLFIGQAYNNWRWPRWVTQELDMSYVTLLRGGLYWCGTHLGQLLAKRKPAGESEL